ncbi:hypothetical protein K502DRAFT_350281 [Neoconidiobolus thromboides FSU 785]|nr:hypothetical protein K502DRAFT_350281 [Neoconidiobolus thromboides FSU 785]
MKSTIIINEPSYFYLKIKILTEKEDEQIKVKLNDAQKRYFGEQIIKPITKCRIRLTNEKLKEHINNTLKYSHGVINTGLFFELLNYDKEKGLFILKVPFCFKSTFLSAITLYTGSDKETVNSSKVNFCFSIVNSSPFLLALLSSRQFQIL